MPKILHIEDDPANRLLVRKLLNAGGFEVIEAEEGLAGIQLARSEAPDLVLVDINIPGLDGYEVTLRLRSEPALSDVPIVAITAEGSRDSALAVGCDGFLQKPIDARSFAKTVSSYLKGHREQTSPDMTDHLRKQSQRIVGHLEDKVRELSEANERLLQADKARKEFYRNVSHELATPMTPILGYVKLIRDEELGPLTPQQKKALGAMDDCVERLRGLIDNLLDVTGLETGRLKLVHREYSLRAVVERATREHEASASARKIALHGDLPPDTLRGHGDRERLVRAVGHLLDNAIKFSPEGSAVAVRASEVEGQRFEVLVVDDGPGVPPDVAQSVFDAFYQVDGSPTRAHGGAGVGLAIVRGVAHGHGGEVRIASPANEVVAGKRYSGAAFRLIIAQRAPSVVMPAVRP